MLAKSMDRQSWQGHDRAHFTWQVRALSILECPSMVVSNK
jgi:hypothetical protein